MLVLMGCGCVAANLLPKSKGQGSGFLFVNWGWGLAVFAGVLVSTNSGAHINPAVTPESPPRVPISMSRASRLTSRRRLSTSAPNWSAASSAQC